MGGQAKDRGNGPAVQLGALGGSIDTIGQIEILDLSTGATSSGLNTGGGGGGSGKVTFQDLQFTKVTDATSPKLLLACATGQHIKNASLTYTSRRGSPTIQYDLEDVLVTSFSIDQNPSDRPTETVTVTYSKIKLTVNGVSAGWDLAKGTAI
jgi:type VI secretion system secreted protein Hcp